MSENKSESTDGDRPSREAMEAIEDPAHRLHAIMTRLLDPGGCPWDREQTHQSLRQYFIEEVYEACEAIDHGDDAALCEELGDVALQIVFHAEMARRRDKFNLDDVYHHICTKLLDRHPHVFGECAVDCADAAYKNWEQIKKVEKRRKAKERGKEERISTLSGVPRSLPGLQRAGRLQERASRVGFDWDRPEDVAEKVREEVEEFLAATQSGGGGETKRADETAMEDEFGDLLFSLVNLSRFLDIRAEEALEKACNKFTRRFTEVEHEAERRGLHLKDMTLVEMDVLWNEVKHRQK